MAFIRKASLGRYNGSRNEWRLAYQIARQRHQAGLEPDYGCSSLRWKAQLIVFNERERQDPLSTPLVNRLVAKQIIDEILADEEAKH